MKVWREKGGATTTRGVDWSQARNRYRMGVDSCVGFLWGVLLQLSASFLESVVSNGRWSSCCTFFRTSIFQWWHDVLLICYTCATTEVTLQGSTSWLFSFLNWSRSRQLKLGGNAVPFFSKLLVLCTWAMGFVDRVVWWHFSILEIGVCVRRHRDTHVVTTLRRKRLRLYRIMCPGFLLLCGGGVYA